MFFVARGSRHNAVKLSGYLHLLVGVQVAVCVHRGLYLLVSEPLRDQQRGETYLHQQAGVAVANVMYPNPLHAGSLAAVLHFVIQKALGAGKESVVLLQPVAMGHILLQTVAKAIGNGNGADAFRCFRSGDNILSAEALIALVHRQGFLFKVDERNRAMSDALEQDVYHYHLHVVYIPVVEKQILWSKRCKDKSLVGTVKETIQ